MSEHEDNQILFTDLRVGTLFGEGMENVWEKKWKIKIVMPNKEVKENVQAVKQRK